MGGEFRQVQLPGLPEIRNQEGNSAIIVRTVGTGEEVPLQPGLPAVSRPCELQLQQQPIPASAVAIPDAAEEIQQQVSPLNDLVGFQIQEEIRKCRIADRCRHMLIPQLGEAVVSRHEEIVAGDVGLLVVWRPLAGNLNGIHVPDLLLLPGNGPPRLQCPVMQVRLHQLRIGALELRVSLLLVVAVLLPVEVCAVPDGAIAILERDGRNVAWHRYKFRSGTAALI